MMDATPARFAGRLFGVEGKLAVVTGASQGIGLAIAESLASARADILGVGYEMLDCDNDVRNVVESLDCKLTPICADFSIREQITALAAGLASLSVNILINNDRTICGASMSDHTDVNLRSTFILSREVGKSMMAAAPTRSSTLRPTPVSWAASTSPAAPPPRRPSPTQGPTSGRPWVSTSTRSRPATSPPSTPATCARTPRAARKIFERIPAGR